MPSESVKAAAQHYGIRTNLLDVTGDPAVAVYFANCSQSRKCGDTAAVFVYNLEFSLNYVKFVFPPPVVDRLYLQRGVFFEVPEEDYHIQKNCFKVLFPLDTDFQFFANGKPKDIMISDEWFNCAIKWSKKWAKSKKSLPNDAAGIDNLLVEIFEEIGYPNRCKYDPALALVEWVDNFEDMVDWFAVRIKGNSEGFLSLVCQMIAKDNPELVTLIIDLYERLACGIDAKKKIRQMWIKALELTHPDMIKDSGQNGYF